MNRTNQIMIFVVVTIFIFIFIYIYSISFIQYPPSIFSIKNVNIVYIIMYDKISGNYVIYPFDTYKKNDYSSGSYISSSPALLAQFVNKKVRIIGRFVWTKRVLKYPNQFSDWSEKIGAVEITSITLAKE